MRLLSPMLKKGFTLIELLIVVAIIAILAAIALPNFLEAQVRSKVSRQQSNMRTVATVLESYMVDHNHYPPVTDIVNGTWSAAERWKIYPGTLTTPIAYLSSNAPLEDVFRLAHSFNSKLAYQIMYLPTFYYSDEYSGAASIYPYQYNMYGMWVIRSAGPDTFYQNMPGDRGDYGTGASGQWNRASYDPTNGTVSAGDIYRSQNDSEKINPKSP